MITGLLVGPLTITASPAAAAAEKAGPLTPRLQKVASVGSSRPSAQSTAAGLPPDGPGSLLRAEDGQIVVEIRVSDPSAIDRAASLTHARVVAQSGLLAELAIEPTALTALAGVDGLLSAQEELTPGTGRRSPAPEPEQEPKPPSDEVGLASCPTGVVSEGDAQLKAALARSTYSVDGSGVKVGVISDSFNHNGGASADVASGDLPGAGNPCGHTTPVSVISEYAGSSTTNDEGRAMVQIVHDLAPGAELLFASGSNGELDFANQIRALKNAGATVIVDDLWNLTEPFYQEGVVAAAITEVSGAGVSYFSIAGNFRYTLGGKSVGSYESSAYRPAACPTGVNYGETLLDCHDFDPSGSTTTFEALELSSGLLRIGLGWNEPQFGVGTDLDLFLVDLATGNVVSNGVDANGTTGRAFEFVAANPGSYALIIGRYSGAATPRLKWISAETQFTYVGRGTSGGGDTIGPTLFGHGAASAAVTTAAVRASNSTAAEPYSSQGPSTTCWQPVSGTSASSAKTCTNRYPDLAASDGVSTTVAGFMPFNGTSAAAPHAAAVNALMRQARPCRTRAELATALAASGRTVGSEGSDIVGSGLIDAPAAVGNLTSCGGATTGLLRAVTSPPVPSQISVDGVLADTWGLTWVKQPPGSHQVCFSNVPGYSISQSCHNVTITAGATTTVTGSFVQGGQLRVITSPPVNSAITVDQPFYTARNNWGLWTDEPVGSHYVCFGLVAGYTPPPCQSVNVTAGATTTVTGVFTPSAGLGPTGVGLLRVTTSPPVPGRISMSSGGADNWGISWLQLGADPTNVVCFGRVEGWTEPACQAAPITSGATTTVTGTYTQRGFLRVVTNPPVPGTITINGVPANDWGVYTDRPTGAYQVCFGVVPAKTAPPCQNVSVTAGNTTTVTGNYT